MDAQLPDCRKRLMSELIACYRTTDEPWESNGSVDLANGAYVQWTRVDDPGSDVHIEINEGSFADPIPAELVDLLVKLGWNAPDDHFRNCWLRAGPPETGGLRTDRHEFFGAADVVILGVTVALGVSLQELSVALAGEESEPGPPARPVKTTAGPNGVRRTVVMEDSQDFRGWQRRELHEEANGSLVIEGQDLGSGVSDFWGGGQTEYEFTRTIAPPAVGALRLALQIGDTPLLEVLEMRFETTSDFEAYLTANGIETSFWSRVGD